MSNSPLVSYTKISPNRTSPRNHKIDTITIHCVVGQLSVEQILNLSSFVNYNPTRGASCNYAIGSDGRIGLCVEEKDRSWCSSNRANDHRAVTIEVASDRTHPYRVNDKVYASLINLVADICKRNNIKELKWQANKKLIGQVHLQNMTVHRWFANKSCPGDYLYNLHGQIAREVNKKLAPATPKPTPTPTQKSFTVKVESLILNMRTGAGTNYSRIKYIPRGVYTIVETKGKWGRLKSKQLYKGSYVDAWICLDYVKKL